MDLQKVINGAIGSFENNCAGYLNPGASGNGYIATLKLSVGQVIANTDQGLEYIVSYDRCEANDAYIGQINMLTASSFCGLNGAIWGYHLAKADGLDAQTPLFTVKRHDGNTIPVMDVTPLLDTTYRLFGVDKQRRFNPLPGAMVLCANKNAYTSKNGGSVWCAIALAIAEDRNTEANLFMEDCEASEPPDEQEYIQKMAYSIAACGADQDVLYKTIFIGLKQLTVASGNVACALTCAPYVTLPSSAIPPGSEASDIMNLTISEWEKSLELPALPPYSACE